MLLETIEWVGGWGSAHPLTVPPTRLPPPTVLQGIVHLDVKSPNILLTGVGSAKLSDVGLSRTRGPGTFLSDLPLVGTFAW